MKWTHTQINANGRAGWLAAYRTHINININVNRARNQLKSTFYFYCYSFLRTRAKFILFHTLHSFCCLFFVWHWKVMHGIVENTHTFDCKETTHIYDYIRCMRLDIIQHCCVWVCVHKNWNPNGTIRKCFSINSNNTTTNMLLSV